MTRIIILGCGSSAGVPVIGCKCAVCLSEDSKNYRGRSSILIEDKDTRIVVDTGYDFRMQMLREKIDRIDAVIYSHAHADHINGLDDIRAFNYILDRPMNVYGAEETLREVETRFEYVFKPHAAGQQWYVASLVPNIVGYGQEFSIGSIAIKTFRQVHGKMMVLGMIINGLAAYSTDLNALPEESIEALYGIETWIVNCLGYVPYPSHAHLDLVLSWVEKIKPGRVVLTNMGHMIDYHEIMSKLPNNIVAAYDGMIINF
jgi:phosphoribosyl 1,2-cyclic phosphate phosphodiesterase